MKRFLLFVVVAFTFSSYVYSQNVAIVFSEKLKVYEEIIEGFKEKVNLPIKEFFIEDDSKKIDEIVSQIKSLKPSVIFSIGLRSTKIVKEKLPEIPLVFSFVVNPHRFGLAGENICGIRLEINPFDTLQMLKELKPTAKNIGVIYDPRRTENFVEEAKRAAEKLNLNILAQRAYKVSDVPSGLDSLKGKIDAFWIIYDPVIANNMVLKKLLLFTLSNKLPLICPAKVFVKKGGLFALDADFKKLGVQAAEIVHKIVFEGISPSEIGIQWPQDKRIFINKRIAKKIGLFLTPSILSRTDEIIE